MHQCRPIAAKSTFPVLLQRQPANTPKVNQLDQKFRNPPVAIIAGHPDLRSSIAMLLTVSGMEARMYRTAKEFMTTRFQQHHCVIASCPVPDVPDHRLCAALLLQRPPVPVILLTDFPDTSGLGAIDGEAVRILSRPFQGDVLLDTIEALTGAVSKDGPGRPGARDHCCVAR